MEIVLTDILWGVSLRLQARSRKTDRFLDCVWRDVLSIATNVLRVGLVLANEEGWAGLTVFVKTVMQTALNVC